MEDGSAGETASGLRTPEGVIGDLVKHSDVTTEIINKPRKKRGEKLFRQGNIDRVLTETHEKIGDVMEKIRTGDDEKTDFPILYSWSPDSVEKRVIEVMAKGLGIPEKHVPGSSLIIKDDKGVSTDSISYRLGTPFQAGGQEWTPVVRFNISVESGEVETLRIKLSSEAKGLDQVKG